MAIAVLKKFNIQNCTYFDVEISLSDIFEAHEPLIGIIYVRKKSNKRFFYKKIIILPEAQFS